MKSEHNTKREKFSRGGGWFVLSFMAILFLLIAQGYFEYVQVHKTTATKSQNLTYLLEEKIKSDFEQVDNILEFALFVHRAIPKEHKDFATANEEVQQKIVSKRLNALANSFEVVDIINFIDANGDIIYSSSLTKQNHINVADRPHFQVLKNDPTLKRSFSDVIASRTTQKRSLAHLRAVRDENGKFLGAISTLISMDRIDSFLSSVDVGTNGVTLLRRSDSTNLISKYPHYDKSDFNQPLPSTNPIVQRIRAGEKRGNLRYNSSTDGVNRLGAFIVLEEYPFYLQIAFSQDDYLRDWSYRAKVAGFFIVLFVIGSFIVIRKINRSYQKEQEAITELHNSNFKLKESIDELHAITEQLEQNQREIQIQKKEFETIFNYAGDGIAVVNFEGNFLKTNKTFQNLTGYSAQELLLKNCNDLTAPEDREKNRIAMKKALETQEFETYEKECIVKENKRLTVHASISALPDKKSLLLILKDISTLKLLEEQSRLASMGEMIGNIAHQWRQPLSIITTSASGMKMQTEYGMEVTIQDIQKFSDLIMQQANYLSATIDNFRNFLKNEKNYITIDLYSVFDHTLRLVEGSLKSSYIEVVSDIDQGLSFYGSENELTEAFINIINNSKDILKEQKQNKQKRYIFISAKQTKNKDIKIVIKDNGGGIKEEHIGKVFEPYYTSKHQSVGTGLGLFISHKIICKRHQGKITAYNETFIYNDIQYTGACFEITLPRKKDDLITTQASQNSNLVNNLHPSG